MRETVSSRDGGTATARSVQRPTLNEAIRPFRRRVLSWNGPEDEREAVERSIERSIERWITRWGGRPVTKIDATDLHVHLIELAQKDFTPLELRAERKILREFWAWVWKQGWTKSSPARALPNVSVPDRLASTIWDAADQRRLLRACRAHRLALRRPPAYLQPLVLLGLRTGLRVGALVHLEWRHVDLRSRVILVPSIESSTDHELRVELDAVSLATVHELRSLANADASPAARVFAPLELPFANNAPDLGAIEGSLRRACRRARVPVGGLDSLRLSFESSREGG